MLLANLAADPQAFELVRDADSLHQIGDGLIVMFFMLHTGDAEEQELAAVALTRLLRHQAAMCSILAQYEYAGPMVTSLLNAWGECPMLPHLCLLLERGW